MRIIGTLIVLFISLVPIISLNAREKYRMSEEVRTAGDVTVPIQESDTKMQNQMTEEEVLPKPKGEERMRIKGSELKPIDEPGEGEEDKEQISPIPIPLPEPAGIRGSEVRPINEPEDNDEDEQDISPIPIPLPEPAE